MYIKDCKAISPQNTISDTFFEEKAKEIIGLKYIAIEPNYRDFIPLRVLRRMGKSVRMATGAAAPILEKHQNIEAIIIATAQGGTADSIKFLNQIIQYEEGTLTPTHFVQSTPNAIAGGLAQMSKCYGYNNTHTNEGLSFEAALLDAKLLLDNQEVKALLLGAVEEVSEFNFNLELLQNRLKEMETISSFELLNSNTKGTVNGEGASMFFVENNSQNAIAKIEDLDSFCYPSLDELKKYLIVFLKKNKLEIAEVDSIILGKSGDIRQDEYYDCISAQFEEANLYTYKNLVGEYPTSSAFATWLACQILQEKKIPTEALYRNKNRKSKIILIYNQFKNKQHSFILLSKDKN